MGKEPVQLDMNLVRQAQREGRFEQMWIMLHNIADAAHLELCLEAIRFIQGLQPFSLEKSLPIFDRLSVLTSPDVRTAVLTTMNRIACREGWARTRLIERMLDYSRHWDHVAHQLSASGSTAVSGLWHKFSLPEKVILRALNNAVGRKSQTPAAVRDVKAHLSIFEPLVPEIELRLKLDSFVENKLLLRDDQGLYQFANDGDRKHIEHFGDTLSLIREHRIAFLNMLSFDNYPEFRQRLKRSKSIKPARFYECFGIDENAGKSRDEFLMLTIQLRQSIKTGANTREIVRSSDALRDALARCIRFEPNASGATDNFLFYSGKKLGLRNPKLSHLTILFPRRDDLDASTIKRLEEWILRESFSQQIFVLFTWRPDRTHLREEAEASGMDIVVFDQLNFMRLAFATSREHAFMRMVVEGCDLESLSPYEPQAPVREMFYGRESLIKEILRTRKGYALVGTRRLGKTSLLFRLQDEIKKRPNTESLFLECGGVTEVMTLADRVSNALHLNLSPGYSLEDFERVLRNWLEQSRKELYCFFDEIDDFVASGKDAEPLWQIFKSLSFEGKLTVYVAGFTELFSRFLDYESLFFNFLIFRKLSSLDYRSAIMLVDNPIMELGLSFEDKETVVAAILEKTSTHPNIIQIFCDLLVKRMARFKRRVILLSDVEETAKHPDFEEAIVRIMQSNLIRPVEKLLLLLIAYYNLRPLSNAQVAELLSDWDIRLPLEDIAKILDRLVLYAVLEEREGMYDFAHPYFATILQHRDVESMISYYGNEVEREKQAQETVRSESH